MIEILKHIQSNYVPQVALEDGTIEVLYFSTVLTSSLYSWHVHNKKN